MGGGPRGGRGDTGRRTWRRSSRRTAALNIGRRDALRPVIRPRQSSHFWPMARSARRLYGDDMSSAVRSFLAEPRASDPPARVWWDWLLLAVIAVGATLETIFRTDLVWVPAGLVACLGL